MSKNVIENAKRNNMYLCDPDDIQIVGLDTKDGPEHPLYDPRHDIPIEESMILNVMVYGVIEPVVVRMDGENAQAVVGRRRIRAAREANRRLRAAGQEPVLVRVYAVKGNNAKMMGIMISENEIRKDDTPLAKARKVQRLLDYGSTVDDVAVTFGVDPKTVNNWLKLLDCDDKVQEAIEAGQISDSAATKLAVLPRAQQKEQLAAMIASGDVTTKTATAVANAKKAENAAAKAGSTETVDIIVAPGRRLIAKVLQAVVGGADLDADAVKALRWAVGKTDAKQIKGLTKILNAIAAEDEELKAAASERESAKEQREAAKAEREQAKTDKASARAAAKVEREKAKADREKAKADKAAAKAAKSPTLPGVVGVVADASSKSPSKRGQGKPSRRKAPPKRG